MSTMIGANPDALRELAREATRAAQRINDAAESLTAGIESQQWRGQDAERFRQLWFEEHRPSLAAATDSLVQAARTVSRNADEQEETSAALGGPNAGPVRTPAPGGSIAPDGVFWPKTDLKVVPEASYTFGEDGGLEMTLLDMKAVFGPSGEYSADGRIFGRGASASFEYEVGVIGSRASWGDGEVAVASQLLLGRAAAESRMDLGLADLVASGEARAGAEAEARVELEEDGLEVEVGGHAGVKAEGNVGLEAGPVEASVGGEVSFGVGAEGELEAGYEDGKLKFGAELDLALGVGVGLDFSVELDIGKAVDTLRDAGEWVLDKGGDVLDWLNPFN